MQNLRMTIAAVALVAAMTLACGSDPGPEPDAATVTSTTGDPGVAPTSSDPGADRADGADDPATDGPVAEQPAGDDPALGEAGIDHDSLLVPSWLPDGWIERDRSMRGRSLTVAYGPLDEPGRTPLTLIVTPVDDGVFNLEAVGRRDLTESETIDVRGGTANGVRVTSFEDGAVTIAFVDDELLYEVLANDPLQPLIGPRFVEGLQAPAEPEPEPEPDPG